MPDLSGPTSWEDNPRVWKWIRGIANALIVIVGLALIAGLALSYLYAPFIGRLRLTRFWIIIVAIAIGLIVCIAAFASGRIAVLSDDVWVSRLVPELKRQIRHERLLKWNARRFADALRNLLRSMFRPRLPAAGLSIIALGLSTALLYVAGKATDGSVSGRYLTLWQLYAGLPSIALPVLIFIIQFGGEEPMARRQRTRALVYGTGVMPILAFLVGSLVAFAIGTQWPGGDAYWAGVALFVLALALTMAAFLRLVYFISHPLALDEASIRLLETLFTEEVESAIDERIGAYTVWRVLSGAGARYSPYWNARPDYWSVPAPQPGRLVDVHLGRLRRLLGSLPRTGAGPAETRATDPKGEVAETPTRDDWRGGPDIVWLYNYGDSIPLDEPPSPILFLRKAAFSEPRIEALEAQIRDAVRITGET